MTYSEKLKDPRWQKRRLEILQRDNWTCIKCGENKEELHVHHLEYYEDPWLAPDGQLETVCKYCHAVISVDSGHRKPPDRLPPNLNPASIKRMHHLYVLLTGYQLEFSMNRLYAWELFCSKFTEGDLRIVVKHIQNRQRQNKPARSLSFRNFISGPSSIDFFAEDLAEAKTESLVRAKIREQQGPMARNHALLSIGRPMPTPDRVKSAEDIMRGNEAFKQFLEMKKNL